MDMTSSSAASTVLITHTALLEFPMFAAATRFTNRAGQLTLIDSILVKSPWSMPDTGLKYSQRGKARRTSPNDHASAHLRQARVVSLLGL
jgi:hypothetical protein